MFGVGRYHFDVNGSWGCCASRPARLSKIGSRSREADQEFTISLILRSVYSFWFWFLFPILRVLTRIYLNWVEDSTVVTPSTLDTRGERRCGRQPGSHSTPSSGVLTGFDYFILKKLFFFAPGQADHSPGRATKFLSLLRWVLGSRRLSRHGAECSQHVAPASLNIRTSDKRTSRLGWQQSAPSLRLQPRSFRQVFIVFPIKKLFLDERTDTETRCWRIREAKTRSTAPGSHTTPPSLGWGISDSRTREDGNDGWQRIAPMLPLPLFQKPSPRLTPPFGVHQTRWSPGPPKNDVRGRNRKKITPANMATRNAPEIGLDTLSTSNLARLLGGGMLHIATCTALEDRIKKQRSRSRVYNVFDTA